MAQEIAERQRIQSYKYVRANQNEWPPVMHHASIQYEMTFAFVA
jgi:hypothetical protein